MTVTADYVHPVQVGMEPLPADADRAAAESVWRVAYGALDLACLVSGAPCGALFACGGDGLRLLATRSTQQHHLDVARSAWADTRSGLARGRPYAHREPPFVVLPCVDGVDIVGALLLGWESDEVQAATALTSLGRVLGASLRRLGVSGGAVLGDAARLGPSATSVRDTQALALYVLLAEQEWNVSRAARVLEVTRMTIYSRMHAAGIEHERVRPSRRRAARATARSEAPLRALLPEAGSDAVGGARLPPHSPSAAL